MHCQTVIKRRNAFRGFVGSTTETRRSDDGAVRNKKRLPKWQNNKFTKHYFEGTSRIVSKLGEGTFHQPSGINAGGIDYVKQSAKVQEAIDQYIKGLNIPPGPPTQHGIYGTPDFTGQEYPSIDWSDISQDQEPPEGWPRPPKFNEPGDVPGPPVQYGDPVKPDNVKGGFGYVDNGIEEKNLYFYHPDHLGSSSYITDANGDVNQHTEYMAFGEVLFDEHKVSRRMPYLFNGKELDSETGLYYYGARYYDPKTSIWLNVDPLAEKTMQPYAYTNNNPIMLIDPDGQEPTPFYIKLLGHIGYYAWRDRDFRRQNPGKTAPDYYMEYGHKYINRFTNETSKTMSRSGKIWLREARKNLQVAIEDRLAKPDGADLERDNDKFRSFAFDSHISAYWNETGKVPLYTLGAVDLTKILLTPDVKDLVSSDGLRQVKGMIGKFIVEKPEELKRILGDAYDNKGEIMNLIENKAKKEGVSINKIKNALSPLLMLIPSKEQNKTE
ncbi:RHS repeat domain-containing protein [Riemerella anatipestifer]|uniref:RHS repeat domain-containing protein n=1 Tax=Riemerella anatipestifer TaxID=34085 RepID=UPI003DA82E8D